MTRCHWQLQRRQPARRRIPQQRRPEQGHARPHGHLQPAGVWAHPVGRPARPPQLRDSRDRQHPNPAQRHRRSGIARQHGPLAVQPHAIRQRPGQRRQNQPLSVNCAGLGARCYPGLGAVGPRHERVGSLDPRNSTPLFSRRRLFLASLGCARRCTGMGNPTSASATAKGSRQ